MSCHNWSFSTFCKVCESELLKPTISKRKFGEFEVYSFYKYSEIAELLLTKHTPLGFSVYRGLAKITLKPFIESFLSNCETKIHIVGVDESVESGYSHVALLTSAMRHKNSQIMHNSLVATNRVKYSGKSLKFRIDNPRNFKYKGVSNIDAILVDDIITSGQTLLEAKKVLELNGVKPLFGLTLADVLE